MKEVFYLLFHLLTALAKLIRPGGSRAVIAENLLLKQQLIIHSRSRQRAPNLTSRDRALLGFWTLLMNPRRIARSAIIIKPSTLLRFHTSLRKRKYRQLYSPRGGRKPAPKVLEGEWGGNWTVVIRFPSKVVAEEWYNSPEYQPLKELRIDDLTEGGSVVLVDGFDPVALGI
jgi:uncharacterized protein (DUF1330 family)